MSRNPKGIEFKPHKRDMTKVLGDLEAEIIEALWTLKQGNVKEIFREVQVRRKVAITTVATVLDRLHEKGLVERELKKSQSLYYEYRQAFTKTEFERSVVESVIKGLFETFGSSTISYLVDQAGIEEEEGLEEFKSYLEKIMRNRDSP